VPTARGFDRGVWRQDTDEKRVVRNHDSAPGSRSRGAASFRSTLAFMLLSLVLINRAKRPRMSDGLIDKF
jgi:hypothetical protein